MFDLGQLFKRADTVQRRLAALLARSRLAYLGHRADRGAKPSTLRGIAALQVNLVRYLELGEDGKVAPAEVEAAAQRRVSQDPARRGGDAEGIRRRFLSQATCWLRFAGRVQVPAAPSHPHATEVAVFVEHMRRERGWSEATIRYRRSRADEFLRRFCRGNRTLADITVEAVDCALSDEETRDGRIRTRATIRNHADALRAFFRFAEDRGWCRPGLAATITSPRVYKDATLPAWPSAEDLERLLATTEGDQPEDLRDRALLLTLSVYGLRAGEARGLRSVGPVFGRWTRSVSASQSMSSNRSDAGRERSVAAWFGDRQPVLRRPRRATRAGRRSVRSDGHRRPRRFRER